MFNEDCADEVFPQYRDSPAVLECIKFVACSQAVCLVPTRDLPAWEPPQPNPTATNQIGMAVVNVSICKYCVLLRGLQTVDGNSGLKEQILHHHQHPSTESVVDCKDNSERVFSDSLNMLQAFLQLICICCLFPLRWDGSRAFEVGRR